MIEVRPFRPKDWEVLLDLANQAVPFAPQENAEWLKYRKAFDASQRTRRHYIITENEVPVGYGCLEQQSDDPQQLRVYVVCSPENLHGQIGHRLYEKLLQDAAELGTAQLWAREFQEDKSAHQFFTGKGFREEKRVALPNYSPMVIYTLDIKAREVCKKSNRYLS